MRDPVNTKENKININQKILDHQPYLKKANVIQVPIIRLLNNFNNEKFLNRHLNIKIHKLKFEIT